VRLLQELDWLDEDALALRFQRTREQPPSPQRDVELALIAIARGNFGEASSYAESAFGSLPEDPYAAYVCGVSRIQRQAWEQSLAALLKISLDFERSHEIAVFCALALIELGRTEEAERLALAVSSVDDETHGTLCALRARCALAAGEAPDAGRLLDEALRYAPNLAWARTLKSSLQLPPRGAEVPTVVI
jgi:tetratricopeptide (TPR) repeat protein